MFVSYLISYFPTNMIPYLGITDGITSHLHFIGAEGMNDMQIVVYHFKVSQDKKKKWPL